MNSLLNIFCYIISNASTRKNLHMVQLMTKSYPNRQEAMSRTHTRGMACFAQINLGQSSQDHKNLSKAKQSKAYTSSGFQTICPNNLGQSSQDSENLSRMPK